MQITSVKVFKMKDDGNLKAIATITIENELVLTGIKVRDGSNGLWVAMPSQKIKEEYRDIYFPVTKEFRDKIVEAVLNEYGEKCCEKAVNISVVEEEGDLPF